MNGAGENIQPGFESVSERVDPSAGRLAEGFAEHVECWARRLHAEGATPEQGGTPDSVPHPGAGVPTRPPTEADFAFLRHAAHQTSLATSNGHVCLVLSDLAPSPSGGGQGWGHHTLEHLRQSLFYTRVVGPPHSPGACPLILDDDGRLYLHRYFDYEVRLARRIMQAARTPPRTVAPAARELLNTLFPPTPDNEVDWQKIAAALALRNTLTIISGGPGTGKTTTVVNLLACLLTQEPHSRIALAAPTGKAAARMTEAIRQRAGHLPADLRDKLPTESFTIHRLLGVNPSRAEFTHHAGNPLPYDALIVDEASMLDLALATRLLEAVPASARIILLGDKDQLAAVEAGAVFAELSADPTLTDDCRRDVADLCGYGPEHVAAPAPVQPSALRDAAVWLNKSYRFGADSGIGKLAKYTNEGRVQEAIALLRDSPWAVMLPPPFAPSQPKGANAEAPPKSRPARKPKEDTASLPLFPELAAQTSFALSLSKGSNPDTSVQWVDPSETSRTPLAAIVAAYAPYFDSILRDPRDIPAITRAFARFRTLCAVREGPSGVTTINDQLTRHARQALTPAAGEQGADTRSPWYAGRPVMVLRNDYVHKLFNGDIGIALPDGSGELAVFFPDGDNGIRAVPTVQMPEHDTAFAMTVHKAQGSEFDAVLVLLPPQGSRVVARELLYTAVTRARNCVTLSASVEVLDAAIEARSRRHSGVPARLRDATMSRE